VNQVMSFGSPTPIEVAVTGANLTVSRGMQTEDGSRKSRRCDQFGRAEPFVRCRSIASAPTVGVTVGESAGRLWRDLVQSLRDTELLGRPSGILSGAGGVPRLRCVYGGILNVPVMQNGAARPLLGDGDRHAETAISDAAVQPAADDH
jgi:hypothetical protein